jgi:hypothetical protein
LSILERADDPLRSSEAKSGEQGTRVPEVNQVTAVNDGPARATWWRTIPGWVALSLGALLYAEVVAASVEAAHNVLEKEHPAWIMGSPDSSVGGSAWQ